MNCRASVVLTQPITDTTAFWPETALLIKKLPPTNWGIICPIAPPKWPILCPVEGYTLLTHSRTHLLICAYVPRVKKFEIDVINQFESKLLHWITLHSSHQGVHPPAPGRPRCDLLPLIASFSPSTFCPLPLFNGGSGVWPLENFWVTDAC